MSTALVTLYLIVISYTGTRNMILHWLENIYLSLNKKQENQEKMFCISCTLLFYGPMSDLLHIPCTML